MKYLQFIILIIGVNFCGVSQTQIPWLVQSEGESNEFISDMSIDIYDNVYVTGEYFRSALIFQNYIFPRGINGNSAYIAKLDQDGNVIWAKAISGLKAYASYTYLDNDDEGNAYLLTAIVGEAMVFGKDTIYNPNQSKETLALCLLKFDPIGRLIYAKVAKGTNPPFESSIAQSIVVDSENACIYTMISTESPTLQIDTIIIEQGNKGISEILVKWNIEGSVIWAKAINTDLSHLGPHDLALDSEGNIIISGNIHALWIEIDGTRLDNPTKDPKKESGYIAKLNPEGDLIWAHAISGILKSSSITQIASDNQGNVYANGRFTNKQFVIGKDTLIHKNKEPYHWDYYIIKYDMEGKVVWARSLSFGQTFYPGGFMTTDSKGNLYGHWLNHLPEVTLGKYTIKNNGEFDNIITKHSPEGDLLWAYGYGGESTEIPAAILTDSEDNLIIGCRYDSHDWELEGQVVYNEFSKDSIFGDDLSNIFIAKIIPDTITSIISLKSKTFDVSAYYSFDDKKINIEIESRLTKDPIKIELIDMAGIILHPSLESLTRTIYQIDAERLSVGIYVIRVEIGGVFKSVKVIVN